MLMISLTFAEYAWRVWRFDKSAKNLTWNDSASLAYFLEGHFGISQPGQWRRITFNMLPYGHAIISRKGGLDAFLSEFFPSRPWSSSQHAMASSGAKIWFNLSQTHPLKRRVFPWTTSETTLPRFGVSIQISSSRSAVLGDQLIA